MKKTFLYLLGAALIVLASCNDDDEAVTPAPTTPVDSATYIVSANITANTTWKTGKTYVLAGRIAVTSGATLTIEPGTVIKGQAGTASNATALIITRGSKIMAEGTETSPIIFTTVADEIVPGKIESPNLDIDANGLWGGLIILGNAPISASAATMSIEGIPADDANGQYGGTDAADNSGVLKYVSLRHGGANIGEGNEINGLTLGGVGSGTTIENIEIMGTQDDGIEWFGGSVSVKNVVIMNCGDDAVDVDQAWSGTLDNFAVINPGDEGFELDGGEGSTTAKCTIKNGSIKISVGEGLADIDDKGVADNTNTNCDMSNIYFFDVAVGKDFDDKSPEMTLANIQITMPSDTALSVYFKGGSDAAASKVAAAANTVGVDVSKLSWTWASKIGELNADF